VTQRDEGCREFVVKQRVLASMQPISAEQYERGSARMGRCSFDHRHRVIDPSSCARTGLRKNIAQHGEQVLHLELELKG